MIYNITNITIITNDVILLLLLLLLSFTYILIIIVRNNTRSPLEDSRLFGPSPWKILATTYEQKKVPEQPGPWRKS